MAPSSSTIHDTRVPASIIALASASPLNSSSTLKTSSDKDFFSHDILSWDSYDEFAQFYSQIGINLTDLSEARWFFDCVRSQQGLPKINLEHNYDCVEQFHALRFLFFCHHDYPCLEY